MNDRTLLKVDLDERRFGSAYDPLLWGVAEGLARLFPPVEDALPCGDDDRASSHRDEAAEGDE